MGIKYVAIGFSEHRIVLHIFQVFKSFLILPLDFFAGIWYKK